MSIAASQMIPQCDPRAGYLAHRGEIDAAIARALDSGRYILGPEVEAFEAEFAAYLGIRHAIGVGNGTDALTVALRACGIGTGDRVITVSHTAVATVAAIELAGATAILVDVDPVTFTMDPNHLEDALLQQPGIHPKAVIPVHLYGHPADVPAILAFAQKHGLYVIEDCAQSHGATLQGRPMGTWGDIAAFSFYPTKNLGALGDGGAIVTNDPRLAEQARLLREYGWRERYVSELAGMNSRLDVLQAAILRVKLKHLDRENARRREIAAAYDELLATTSLSLPAVSSEAQAVYHQYVVRSPRRDDLREFLKAKGVGTLIHYPMPVHMQPAYRSLATGGGAGLPHTEEVCREIVSLPMYPQLSEGQVQFVSKAIRDWDAHTRGSS